MRLEFLVSLSRFVGTLVIVGLVQIHRQRPGVFNEIRMSVRLNRFSQDSLGLQLLALEGFFIRSKTW